MDKVIRGMQERMAEWMSEPTIDAASYFLNTDIYKNNQTHADAVGTATMQLSDPGTRRAIWSSLATGPDPMNVNRMIGSAIASGDIQRFFECCSVFKVDAMLPQWLALATLSRKGDIVNHLIAMGVEPEDGQRMPALAFATFEGVEKFVGLQNESKSYFTDKKSNNWDAKSSEPIIAMLGSSSMVARMGLVARVVALDALAANLLSVMGGRDRSLDDLGLASVPASVMAISNLWTSMPLEDALQARSAARVVFGAVLGVNEKLFMLSDRKYPKKIGIAASWLATPPILALAALAGAQDWARAEDVCQERDWTLASTAMDFASKCQSRILGEDGSESGVQQLGCFAIYERLCGRPIDSAKGVLDQLDGKRCWAMEPDWEKESPGALLTTWMTKHGRKLPASEVARALRAYARMAKEAEGAKEGQDYNRGKILPRFSSEMHALCQESDVSEVVKKELGELAREWNASAPPEGDIHAERGFLDVWADRLDIAAVVIQAAGTRAEPIASKRRL